ncbi:MAG TPA: SDR family oxidoreductase [Solirubrobacteraceae bacterium]|nr:SDR family oxidoreductase [Solirubrobacteraceae bacterium]
MILVVGATGTTGSVVVRELLDAGVPVRGLTRFEEGAQELRALGAEAVVGDLADPLSFVGALRSVERMYLVSSSSEHSAELERNAISAAEQEGVYHCVKLGALGQSASSPVRYSRAHADAIDALQSSSLRWTVLLASSFMQNVLAAAPTIATGQYFSSIGDARVAHVDARDVGAVAARALAQEGHENCTYTLTGPESLSNDELVATLSEVLGREVEHVRLDDEQVAAALRQAGVPDWNVDGLVEMWEHLYRSGAASAVTPDVEAVLGRPPRTFRRFAEDHREVFSG